MTASPSAPEGNLHPRGAAAEGTVERVCGMLCKTAICVMLLVIGTDIFTRSLLNYSFEISDEIGGYMLVLITFVSLSVCQANNTFHHVEFVQMRLSPRARAISRLVFDVMALVGMALLFWETARFELGSFASGDRAPTLLATPLWLPRIVMPLGALAICLSLCRTILMHARHIAALGRAALDRSARA